MDLAILLISVIGNLSLGSLVYFKNPKSSTSIIFASLTASLVLMLVANYFSVASTDPNVILPAIRFAMFFAALLSFFYLLLVLNFPNATFVVSRKVSVFMGLLTLLTMATALSPFLFTGLIISGASVQPTPG